MGAEGASSAPFDSFGTSASGFFEAACFRPAPLLDGFGFGGVLDITESSTFDSASEPAGAARFFAGTFLDVVFNVVWVNFFGPDLLAAAFAFGFYARSGVSTRPVRGLERGHAEISPRRSEIKHTDAALGTKSEPDSLSTSKTEPSSEISILKISRGADDEWKESGTESRNANHPTTGGVSASMDAERKPRVLAVWTRECRSIRLLTGFAV